MARVRRSKTEKKNKITPAKGGKQKLKIELPKERSRLSDDFREFSVLVHGEKKIGKTSLFANEDGALFLEYDPEQTALSIYQMQMDNWETFTGVVELLEEKAKAGDLEFKTVVVDGIGHCYDQAFSYMCEKLKITHPHDENDYGKSWGKIKTEFKNWIMRLMRIPGVATRFICHSVWKETKTRHGIKQDKLIPELSGQAESVLIGLVDFWAAYTYDQEDRVLIIRGDENVAAGHRIEHAFNTLDGRQITDLYMGSSSTEAYENILAGFNNEIEFVNIAEMRKKKTRKKRARRSRSK